MSNTKSSLKLGFKPKVRTEFCRPDLSDIHFYGRPNIYDGGKLATLLAHSSHIVAGELSP